MTLEALKKYPAKKAIILGSGVSVFSDKKPLATVSYKDIDNWPLGKVKGHKGVLDIYDGIWVLRGRAHLYEGFTWKEACFPTQFLADHGIEELILTNAAGGLNPNFEIGDLMQITGYLNMLEPNKERGNIDILTQKLKKFPTEKLSLNHIKHLEQSQEQGLREPDRASRNLLAINEGECNAAIGATTSAALHFGNYIGVHGPNYETDLEVEVFRSMKADAVGMSTIPEIETAVKNKLKVQAVSVITNVYGKTEDLGHEGVVVAAKNASKKLTELLGIS